MNRQNVAPPGCLRSPLVMPGNTSDVSANAAWMRLAEAQCPLRRRGPTSWLRQLVSGTNFFLAPGVPTGVLMACLPAD